MQLLSENPLARVLHPTIPVDIFLQEAPDLNNWSGQDNDRRVGRGLDRALYESLSMRIGALRHAQSLWDATWHIKEDAQKQWANASPIGFALTNTLGHEFLFAYRNESDILSTVRHINEGSGSADMVQDLSDFEVLGRKFPEPLEAIQFDFSQLDTAVEMSTRLSGLLAASRGKKSDKKLKKDRDQVYTYLKVAVDEIREYGKFVFWQNPERLKGYASDYGRQGPSSDDAGDTPPPAGNTGNAPPAGDTDVTLS